MSICKGLNLRIIAALIICAVIILPSCSQEQRGLPDITNFTPRMRHTTEFFGTVSILRVYDDFSRGENVLRYDRAWDRTREILRELDHIFSLNIETSETSRFNALNYGETMEVSHHMAQVIRLSGGIHEKTGGLYDPTVFPLVDLWGFTPRFTGRFVPVMPYDRPEGRMVLPAPEYIEAFVRLVDFGGVILTGDRDSGYFLTKKIPSVTINGVTYQAKLDFGGIVKGYAADLVRDMMVEEGILFGYFSCGGSSIAFLKGMDRVCPQDEIFEFGLRLRKPRPGQNPGSAFAEVSVRGQSISTSGDYDRAFFLDGVRYSHTFDPRSGHPVNMPVEGIQKGIAKATVISVNRPYAAASTEGLSTAFCVMSPSEAISFINNSLGDYEVILVLFKDGHDYFEVITNIPSHRITILDPAYVMASRIDDYGNVEYVGSLFSYGL